MSTLEQFFSKSSSLPVGSVRAVAGSTGISSPNTFSDSSGLWVKTGLVYSQETYPELFSQLGKINAADYTRISTNTPTLVTYTNNAYFYGGLATSTSVMLLTSTDALTWNGLPDFNSGGGSRTLVSLTHANGIYVAATSTSFGGSILTSTDLNTWNIRATEPFAGISATKYLGGKYFYTQDNFTQSMPASIASSTDAISWQQYTTGTTSSVFSATYGNNLYLISAGAGNLLSSTNGVNWSLQTSGTTSTIYGMQYVSGAYTLVGNGGMIRSSTDLVTWTARTSGTTSTFYDLAYGSTATGSLYVAGGVAGLLRASTDGITWTTRTSGTTNTINNISFANNQVFYGAWYSFGTSTDGVTWANKLVAPASSVSVARATFAAGLYVVVGDTGLISTSTDAITWTSRTSGTTSLLNTVTYGGGLFVAAGAGGNLRSSTNGVNWTARTTGTTSAILGAIYDGSKYVVVGAGGMIRTSTDLVTWSAAASGTTTQLSTIDYRNGLYVVTGLGGLIRTSTDLVTWTARTSGTTTALQRLFYTNNQYFAAGTAVLKTSTDAVTWTNVTGLTISSGILPVSVDYLGGYYIVQATGVTLNDSVYKYTSTDGTTWVSPTESNNMGNSAGPYTVINDGSKLVSLSYNGLSVYYTFASTSPDTLFNYRVAGSQIPSISNTQNSFYALGKYYVTTAGAVAYTSTDLVTWNIEPIHPGNASCRLVYDDQHSLFIKKAANSIYTSTDFVTWNLVHTALNFNINNHVAYSDNSGRTLFAGTLGVLSSSANGVDWNTVPNHTFRALDLAYNGTDTYVAAGYLGRISTSSDGVNWTQILSGLTNTINSVIYANQNFVAAGASGLVATSTNGTTWTTQTSGTAADIYDVEYDGIKFKYLTNTGSIGTSTDAVSWTVDTKLTGTSALATNYRATSVAGTKYLQGIENNIYVSNNTGLLEYSPSYDVNTSFLVPTVTTSNTFATTTSALDTEIAQTVYIKAKP